MGKSESNTHNWKTIYDEMAAEEMPWYCPDLDFDVENYIRENNLKEGIWLDLGTGPATQAIALKQMGFEVVGTDISTGAINRARKIAPDIRFEVDDILDTRLSGQFDFILDRGCFHLFNGEERTRYVASVKRLLKPGGVLLLKTFSDREPETGSGPNRLSEAMLRKIFEKDFDIGSIHHSEFRGNRQPPPKALFAVLRKKPDAEK